MRVLCSTTPMEGVFAPFVPLGQALLRAGHDVLVATGPDLAERVRREGFAAAAAGPTAMEAAMAALADPAVTGAAPGGDRHFGATMFGAVMAPAKLPVLRQLVDEYRPDLLVHAPVDLAAPLLAAERSLPAVTYGFGMPLDSRLVDALADRVAPLWRAAGLEPDPCAGLFRDLYLDPCPPRLRPPGSAPVNTEPIRSEIPGDRGAPLPGWAARLGGRRVVYVSLGTVPFFNQPSTFVMLLSELAHEDLDLVVTVSELHDPAALGAQPGNVHVEQWLPLAALLPLCDAVVCHAGAGTTLAALAAGLPLVLVPQGADQHSNAEACRRAGVARVLQGAALDSAAVRDAVLGVLAPGSGEGDVARRMATEISAMPAASQVVRDLEQLVIDRRVAADGARNVSFGH